MSREKATPRFPHAHTLHTDADELSDDAEVDSDANEDAADTDQLLEVTNQMHAFISIHHCNSHDIINKTD